MGYREIDKEYYYEGKDLGSIYTKEATMFRLWAPTAEKVVLNLYQEGLGDNLLKSLEMEKSEKGTWYQKVETDLNRVYYTYEVTVQGKTNEVVDIYAKACGANGKRGMVVDLEESSPNGWEQDKQIDFKRMNDAIIYELHVRDLSADSSSGIKQTGKYLGLIEKGTKNAKGLATGLDHMKELGITHVHLLPIHDYCTVDEEHLEIPQYNWGYDPQNYNIPEGSYATDPFHGEVRIKEYKEAIQEFHKNHIGVVMDVVYNHTYDNVDSYFEKTVPGYYYRMKEDGTFSNGTACGNETASEHKMMRKFMIDSICHWAKEYHIDGFRFDLMAIHDIDTMNEIEKALHQIDPNIMIYGEGWHAGNMALEESMSAKKVSAKKMPGIAMFNDQIRDGIKGHVFDEKKKGFVNGKQGEEEVIKFSVTGACGHRQVNGIEPWAGEPSQSINYVSAHDDLTLWDKLAIANCDDSVEIRKSMNKLATAIVFTSQGVPFIQAGEELLKTKPSLKPNREFENNSYKSPDSVNSIKWDLKTTHFDIFEYYKGLIAFRKAHAALRMSKAQEVQNNIEFLDAGKNVVAFLIERPCEEEVAEKIAVIYNANRVETEVSLPKGIWTTFINGEKAGNVPLETKEISNAKVAPLSAMVLTLSK